MLDEFCFGSYDFVYLRIDFLSACNVGYAFINFTNMQGMLKFVENMEHKLWPGYRSAKSAEVSYATIQGKEALIQKFRNSSVMQETPFCRPRLFVSKQDAMGMNRLWMTGTAVDFPHPDNQAKLQRSMDSARTVGLYPPHGAGSGNDHRNRFSAYDRGTPRDLVQSMAAMQLAPRNEPTPYQHVPAHLQDQIEAWYNTVYGSRDTFTNFRFIPLANVLEYLVNFHNAGVSPSHAGVGPSHVGVGPSNAAAAGPSHAAVAGPSNAAAAGHSTVAGPSQLPPPAPGVIRRAPLPWQNGYSHYINRSPDDPWPFGPF